MIDSNSEDSLVGRERVTESQRVEIGREKLIRRLWRALLGPASLCLLATLAAASVAFIAAAQLEITAALLCSGRTVRGENIFSAFALVGFWSLAEVALLTVWFFRGGKRFLTAIAVLGVVVLAVAIALVAQDSATYIVATCGTARAGYLYYAWGALLLIFLCQAVRVFKDHLSP